MKKITFILSLLILCSHGIIAQSTATYDINFTSTWNESDHGTLPGNAHWSNLVGANHNSNIVFLEMGGMATPGIEDVAETGSNTAFNAEVNTAITAGDAEQWFQQGFSPFAAISSATLTDVVISEDYPLLTLLSMIAPSPDWIIAVNSLNLWDTTNSNWKDSFSLDLYPYDAGTENGFGYSTSNTATSPQGVIASVAGASGYPFGSAKIGTLTVTFKSTTLNTNDFDSLESVRFYPNPSNSGFVTVTNSNVLEEITIYNVLGKQVRQVNISNTTQNKEVIDVSDLNDGIYIVKLTSNDGATESKKLILN